MEDRAKGERRHVADKDWLGRLNSLLQAIANSDGDASGLRSFLFGLYHLLLHAGAPVQAAFEGLTAEELTDGQRELAERLSAGRYQVPSPFQDLGAAVAHSAKLLRAAEAALIGLGELQRNPRRAEELAVSYDGFEGWLLPFLPRFRGEPGDWPPYFAKRALTRLRCLSAVLPSGMRLDLKLVDAAFGEEISAAACLFESLHLQDQHGQLVTEESVGPLIVTDIQGRAPDTLEKALAQCCADGQAADIIVFPELSITPAEQAAVAHLLATRPWDEKLSGPRPQIVIAGSWHDAGDDGRYRNRAPAFSKGGRLLGRHVKHMVFGVNHEGGVLKEGIAPGEEILVLASPSLVAGVAVCLDFCQVARANPYHELDVDLVLVTSLAGAKTTEEHAKQAEFIWARRKAGTFLAQQDERANYGVSGALPDPSGFAALATAAVSLRKIRRAG